MLPSFIYYFLEKYVILVQFVGKNMLFIGKIFIFVDNIDEK
jgi:hypothetical protein